MEINISKKQKKKKKKGAFWRVFIYVHEWKIIFSDETT